MTWRACCQGAISVLFNSANIYLEAFISERWSIMGSEPSCLVHIQSHHLFGYFKLTWVNTSKIIKSMLNTKEVLNVS